MGRREIYQKFPQRHSSDLRPKIVARIRDTGQGEMNHPLVGAQPAVLRVVGHLFETPAELRHEFFDLAARQWGDQSFDQRLNLPISRADRENDTRSSLPRIRMQVGHDIGVNRIGVHRVGSVAFLERELPYFGRYFGDRGH